MNRQQRRRQGKPHGMSYADQLALKRQRIEIEYLYEAEMMAAKIKHDNDPEYHAIIEALNAQKEETVGN